IPYQTRPVGRLPKHSHEHPILINQSIRKARWQPGKNIAMWRSLADGKLVVTGSVESPTTPPVPIDPQIFQALNGPGPTSSALEGQFGSGIEIFNIRVFPVLRAPNAACYLNGLSLLDASPSYVPAHPQVLHLANPAAHTQSPH